MSFIVCAYYTKGTPYEHEALKLKESLDNVLDNSWLDLNIRIEAIPNLGSWQKNTLHKAWFIKQMMNDYFTRDIVYVDVDARFHTYPKLFNELDCDLAAYFRDWRFAKNELLSGTLYVANIPKMFDIIDEWIAENKTNPNTWEQKNLQAVVSRHPDLNIHQLPVEYCCIYDSQERRNGCKPVIEHLQRSRRYRRMVNAR